MGYECNEMNFVLMHKEAVFQVATKSNLPTALTMMKINKVMMKQKSQNQEGNYMNAMSVEDTESTSKPHPSPLPIVAQSPKKKISRSKKETKSVDMVSVATQTKKEVIAVNLAADEDEFSMFDLEAMRQNFLITTIREQDFAE